MAMRACHSRVPEPRNWEPEHHILLQATLRLPVDRARRSQEPLGQLRRLLVDRQHWRRIHMLPPRIGPSSCDPPWREQRSSGGGDGGSECSSRGTVWRGRDASIFTYEVEHMCRLG